MTDTTDTISTLNEQLIAAAGAFTGNAQAFGDLLNTIAADISRASSEPLEIFPVCHHSAASALHMVRRLREQPPRVLYIELCEDMLPLVENLRDCSLPVALQAFAAESDTLPAESLPVAVVAPLTDASAEYQAIAYALNNPETQLVFVDRGVDFVFQWDPDWQAKTTPSPDEGAAPSDEATLHGTAVGVTVGALEPTYEEFLTFLLRNSNTRHFSEWWEQYVERAIINADYGTYREVMFLVGSLLRRLGQRQRDITEDRLRERHMWTRIKQHMYEHGIAASEAMYICGAAHSASDVAEFGTATNEVWDLPPASNTNWLFGIIPSSYAAIEQQFGHPAGTVGLAEESWQKSLKTASLRPFNAKKADSGKQTAKPSSGPRVQSMLLTSQPETAVDTEQLLNWCTQVVAVARRNGYLASTADSIAIYQTAIMLAQLRNRTHPSPFDFQDAAVTCLEKDRTPKKRTIAQICQIVLGGDRVGKVGYASLPPLAQNVYDRLAPLGLNLEERTNKRALMDFKSKPELRSCSEVLWKLHYLLGDNLVEPIIGERKLGVIPIQESWDIRIGREQRALIQLGYEGVTLEQVLEQRIKLTAFGEQATASIALKAAEDALLYMRSDRLVRELGEHATRLLADESGAKDAPDIFNRARRLVHHYRGSANGLPRWIEEFVATGYAHYAALLPKAFADGGTTPAQIAGMLGFIFTLESFALALGSRRDQLLIGVQQAGQETAPPDKIGLLWAAEWLLGLRDIGTIRASFYDTLDDGLRLPSLPDLVSGLVLALTFAPGFARMVVELLSAVFGRLPDTVLLPLLPKLVMQLRDQPQIVLQMIKEASAVFPSNLAGFDQWEPSWMESAPASDETLDTSEISAETLATRELLQAHPATLKAVATWLQLG